MNLAEFIPFLNIAKKEPNRAGKIGKRFQKLDEKQLLLWKYFQKERFLRPDFYCLEQPRHWTFLIWAKRRFWRNFECEFRLAIAVGRTMVPGGDPLFLRVALAGHLRYLKRIFKALYGIDLESIWQWAGRYVRLPMSFLNRNLQIRVSLKPNGSLNEDRNIDKFSSIKMFKSAYRLANLIPLISIFSF